MQVEYKPIRDDLQIVISQVGGLATNILKAFKSYIRPNDRLQIVSKTSNKFDFDDNINTKKISNSSKYLANGTFTVVFAININGKSGYVLRITEEPVDKLVDKYLNIDSKIIPKNLPQIMFYGSISFQKYVWYYTIVPTYRTNFNSLSDPEKLYFITDLLTLLDILQTNGYVHDDLKLDNVGFDSSVNCILIDYDANTISPNASVSELFNARAYSGSTYVAPYLIANQKNTQSDTFYNKSSAGGLAQVIISIYGYNTSWVDTYLSWSQVSETKGLINTGEFEQLINGHITTIPDSVLTRFIYYVESNTGLLSTHYERVPTYSTILNKLNNLNK